MFITTHLYNSNNILANINKWDLFCFYSYTKTKIIVSNHYLINSSSLSSSANSSLSSSSLNSSSSIEFVSIK